MILFLFVPRVGTHSLGFGPFFLHSVQTGEAAEGLGSRKDETKLLGSNRR